MKLLDLFESSEDKIARPRITNEEFDVLYDVVNNGSMTQKELHHRCDDFFGAYNAVGEQRSRGAMFMAAVRMYMLVHGELPIDMVEDNHFFDGSGLGRFKAWALDKGIDIQLQLSSAQAENERRKLRRPHNVALQVMSQYWKTNSRMYDKNKATANRDTIIKALEDGASPEDAFAPYKSGM